jgi:hypothetical protein
MIRKASRRQAILRAHDTARGSISKWSGGCKWRDRIKLREASLVWMTVTDSKEGEMARC